MVPGPIGDKHKQLDSPQVLSNPPIESGISISSHCRTGRGLGEDRAGW